MAGESGVGELKRLITCSTPAACCFLRNACISPSELSWPFVWLSDGGTSLLLGNCCLLRNRLGCTRGRSNGSTHHRSVACVCPRGAAAAGGQGETGKTQVDVALSWQHTVTQVDYRGQSTVQNNRDVYTTTHAQNTADQTTRYAQDIRHPTQMYMRRQDDRRQGRPKRGTMLVCGRINYAEVLSSLQCP